MNGQDTGHVFDVTRENFQVDVIEASRDHPVVLIFFAPQVPSSTELAQKMSQLADAYSGAFRLGLVDMSQDPGLAQPMRVQGLPSIRVVRDGGLANALDGPQTEAELRQLIDELTLSSSELLRERLDQFMEHKDYAGALRVVRQALEDEPNNPAFLVEFADLLALTGKIEDAREVLGSIPESTEGRSRVVIRLELMAQADGLDQLDRLREVYQNAPNESQACYSLAVKLAVTNEYEEALELALTLLMNDREYGEDAGRKLMLQIFELLGKGSGLSQKFRRKMFNFLH